MNTSPHSLPCAAAAPSAAAIQCPAKGWPTVRRRSVSQSQKAPSLRYSQQNVPSQEICSPPLPSRKRLASSATAVASKSTINAEGVGCASDILNECNKVPAAARACAERTLECRMVQHDACCGCFLLLYADLTHLQETGRCLHIVLCVLR